MHKFVVHNIAELTVIRQSSGEAMAHVPHNISNYEGVHFYITE